MARRGMSMAAVWLLVVSQWHKSQLELLLQDTWELKLSYPLRDMQLHVVCKLIAKVSSWYCGDEVGNMSFALTVSLWPSLHVASNIRNL